MTRMRKDLAATAVTALVVLVFAATHEGWDVPLVGGSHRWAAAAILLLGAVGCGLGDTERPGEHRTASVLGGLAAVLAVLALATGSLTPLSLLVAVIVALWALSTAQHLTHVRRVHPSPGG
jgi:hypothetical protein